MNDNIEETLKNINLFLNCGEPKDLGFNYVQVNSLGEALSLAQDVSWENIVLEKREDLRLEIKEKEPNEYKNWNNIAKEAREFISSSLSPKWKIFIEKNNLGKEFYDSVHWDTINIILVNKFVKLSKNQEFYDQLLKVYLAGKFPCGWNNGMFLAY